MTGWICRRRKNNNSEFGVGFEINLMSFQHKNSLGCLPVSYLPMR